MPSVSVVMPVYNGERFLRESIRSVLAQTFTDVELIVVDDGSTDASAAVVREFMAMDDRVRLLQRPNSGGPAVPKNEGIRAARGRYVCFLDADDLYDDERTARLVAQLERHPEWVAAFHDVRLVDEDGRPRPGTYLRNAHFLERAHEFLSSVADGWYECSERFYAFQSVEMAAAHTQSILIAKDRMDASVLRFDPTFVVGEDTDLWIRIGMQGRLGFLDVPLSSYRQHGSSVTRNRERYLRSILAMHEANFRRVRGSLSPGEIRRYRARIAAAHADLGFLLSGLGHFAAARRSYAASLDWGASRAGLRGWLKNVVLGCWRGMWREARAA